MEEEQAMIPGMEAMESWLAQYMGSEYVWWAQVFLIVLVTLVIGFAVNRVLVALEKRAYDTRSTWDDSLIEALRKPAVWLVWILGINFAARLAAYKAGTEWHLLLEPVNRLAVIFLLALFLLNFIKRAEHNLRQPGFVDNPPDQTTVLAIGRVLRATVIISAILIAMQAFGYSISGLIAFGGVGGLAVGFAARDLLANFFGAIMIYLDRPFSVGDWVRSPDRDIEGVVEDIGWRLTLIRTFDKRPLYIPNAVFTTISVENPSRMLNRRIFENIGVRYADVAKVQAIVEDVKAMLQGHEEIDQDQTQIVNFNRFAPSSLEFMVYTFTKTINWVHFHEVKQDVMLRIADIIAGHDAEIAFPTSTIHVPETVRLAQVQQQAMQQDMALTGEGQRGSQS